MWTRNAALSLVVLALALAPAASSAQHVTLSPERSCYGARQVISLTGHGFTPDGDVSLSIEGQQVGMGIADYDGVFSATMRAPAIPFAVVSLRFTATDQTYRLNRATATVRLASLGVVVTPRTGDPSRTRRIRARGFFGGDVLYAHVRRGDRTRDVRLGALGGPCRSLDVRRRLFPPGVDTGRYTLRFDTNPDSSARAGRNVTYAVTIARARRASAASATGVREGWRLMTP
ncbi:MAG TPA: hypothetical protein VEX36_10250 [Thermoleophilaceae bacterium]|nr:hypothetical protein [Thermoleophilaceae bacterium]